MIRARWLAALVLASTPLPCPAQMGGMGGGGMGGRAPNARAIPIENWTVRFEMNNNQAVTGRLRLQAIAIQCDLGLYRIKPEKVKSIEFEPRGEEGALVGPEGAQYKGTIVTFTGEKIAGVVSIPQDWEVQTDLGSLKPDGQNLKTITFVEQIKPGQPQFKQPPTGNEKPGGDGGKPGPPKPNGPTKPD